jgi:membrane protease YdiL (CAAX protease family)
MNNIKVNGINGWQKVLLFIIPFILTLFASNTISYLLVNFVFNIKSDNVQLSIIKLFDALFISFLLLFFVKFFDKSTLFSLGFSIKNRVKDIFLGIFLGFFVMIGSYYFLLYCNEIKTLETTIIYNEIIIAFFKFLFVAYLEEIVFRGYILNQLMTSFSKFWALVWSSLLFALIHGLNPNMDWFSFSSLFLAGIFLGITYIYTKNLWFAIALHFSWNFFQSLIGFNVSGHDFYSIINFEVISPNRLNGGNFGLEGSYISTIIEILFIFLVVLYYSKYKKHDLQYKL